HSASRVRPHCSHATLFRRLERTRSALPRGEPWCSRNSRVRCRFLSKNGGERLDPVTTRSSSSPASRCTAARTKRVGWFETRLMPPLVRPSLKSSIVSHLSEPMISFEAYFHRLVSIHQELELAQNALGALQETPGAVEKFTRSELAALRYQS